MPKVAAIQMCSSHDVKANLHEASLLLKKAADSGALLAVLPENFALMAKDPRDKQLIKEQFQQGPLQDFLAEMSVQNKLWIVGGTIPLAGSKESHVRAACLVYNDQGMLVARYDKIHLFDVVLNKSEVHQESQTIEPGSDVVTITTPIGKVGLAICYDLRFPELFRQMQQQAVEMIALPAAFTEITGRAHWEVLTRSRAIENLCYFVGAAQSGLHSNGRSTYGHSLIINPWGEILSECKTGTGVVSAEIDLKYLNEVRTALPAGQHRRFD